MNVVEVDTAAAAVAVGRSEVGFRRWATRVGLDPRRVVRVGRTQRAFWSLDEVYAMDTATATRRSITARQAVSVGAGTLNRSGNNCASNRDPGRGVTHVRGRGGPE